jgi:hypothetical protein
VTAKFHPATPSWRSVPGKTGGPFGDKTWQIYRVTGPLWLSQMYTAITTFPAGAVAVVHVKVSDHPGNAVEATEEKAL